MSTLYDVIIYGATAGGVMAAVAAAGEGVTVALLEPRHHVGGMVSGGLGWTDVGQREVVGGLAYAFYERVGRAYDAPAFAFVGPEPHVAERVLREWLEAAGVEVLFGRCLHSVEDSVKGGVKNSVKDSMKNSVTKSGRRIISLNLEDEVLEAAVFIDASYEGDLLAAAGVSYAVGREGVATYGESWAGRQPLRPGQHQFGVYVSPFEDDRDTLSPLVHDRPLAPVGSADGAVQGYGFRLCLTTRADNRLEFPQPPDYDPARFDLLRRYLWAKGDGLEANDLMVLRANLPNGKADVNSKGPLSTNLLDGSNWAYPEADTKTRAEIWRRHLHYTQSLLYFLANDPEVPKRVQKEINRWGLCKDEFGDTGHWPHQLYIREARRLRGEYTMTQRDLECERVKYDSVGMGSYHIDVRHTQRVWEHVHLHPKLEPAVFNEGYLSVPVKPYDVPYRALLPRYGECENLLVPVCVSASHVAFASLRMEPQYMVLGHSAGVAAALAVKQGRSVQHVNVIELQERLKGAHQVLSLPT